MRNGATGTGGWGIVVAAVVVAACHYYYETPAPKHFTSADVDTIAFDSIRTYAHALKFDTVLYAADVKRMRFSSTGKTTIDSLGDSARIEPELGAWALDSTELAQGRIIARIRTDSVHSPVGYGPWWTWWWVDRRGGQWRSLLLSDSLQTRFQDSLRYTVHGHWRQSIARWGSQWGTCSKSACCEKQ